MIFLFEMPFFLPVDFAIGGAKRHLDALGTFRDVHQLVFRGSFRFLMGYFRVFFLIDWILLRV
jgi:hypothetical protein